MPKECLLLNTIKPSHQLFLALIILHALAALSVFILPLDAPIELFFKPFLFVLVLFSCFHYYKKSLHIVSITMKPDNKWDLLTRDGIYYSDKYLECSYVSDWLVILIFSEENECGRIYVHILRDSIDINILSELKCLLNIDKRIYLGSSG